MVNFKNLEVWKLAIESSVVGYRISGKLPKEEKYGLQSQFRRSVVSIASNIAEGAGKSTKKDFGKYLDNARGSAFEAETQLIMMKKLEFIEEKDLTEMQGHLIRIQKMISSYIAES